MDASKESISKFLIGNRYHVKLRILSPYSNRIIQTYLNIQIKSFKLIQTGYFRFEDFAECFRDH